MSHPRIPLGRAAGGDTVSLSLELLLRTRLLVTASSGGGKTELIRMLALIQVNDLRIDWSEARRRAKKPCVVCGESTRGRMRTAIGIEKPAHLNCVASLALTDRAADVCGSKELA